MLRCFIKKYLIIALGLLFVTMSTQDVFLTPKHYHYAEMTVDMVSGAAHAFRIAGMKETNANLIKQRALAACATSLLALIVKTVATFKQRLPSEDPSSLVITTEQLAEDLLESWNAFRMYRNAENIATYNKKQNHSKLPQAMLLLLLTTNRLLKLGDKYGHVQSMHLEKFLTADILPFYFRNGKSFSILALLSTLATALYEHGYYDAIKEVS